MANINSWKTTKIAPALHAVLKAEAARNGMSLADLCEIIIQDWLKRAGIPVPPAQRMPKKPTDLFLVGLKDIADD